MKNNHYVQSIIRGLLLIGVLTTVGVNLLVSQEALNWDQLDFRNFIEQVERHHPVSRQLALFDRESDAYMLRSRGKLDPKLEGNLEQKYFKDDNYFRFIEGTLKVPTMYGLEVNAGYDLNDGVNLNPADLLPSSGLFYVGLKANLLRGLIYNERRAAIDYAELFRESNDIDRAMIQNELIGLATEAFVKLQIEDERRALADNYTDLAREMKLGTGDLFQSGDGRAIDTLEALINLESRKNIRLKISSSLAELWPRVNAFFWSPDGEPLSIEMPESIPDLDPTFLQEVVNSIIFSLDDQIPSHPRLANLDNKMAKLDVERRLLKENLKPNLSLQYNPFLYQWDERAFNDYKWRVGFNMPLYFREARGELELNKIEQESYDLKRKDTKNKLLAYARGLFDKMTLLDEQLKSLATIVDNSELLARAERSKFELGESTVFLVNQREEKWFDQKWKYLKVKEELVLTRIKLLMWLNYFGTNGN